jgi:hypothetical protein
MVIASWHLFMFHIFPVPMMSEKLRETNDGSSTIHTHMYRHFLLFVSLFCTCGFFAVKRPNQSYDKIIITYSSESKDNLLESPISKYLLSDRARIEYKACAVTRCSIDIESFTYEQKENKYRYDYIGTYDCLNYVADFANDVCKRVHNAPCGNYQQYTTYVYRDRLFDHPPNDTWLARFVETIFSTVIYFVTCTIVSMLIADFFKMFMM